MTANLLEGVPQRLLKRWRPDSLKVEPATEHHFICQHTNSYNGFVRILNAIVFTTRSLATMLGIRLVILVIDNEVTSRASSVIKTGVFGHVGLHQLKN